VDLCFVPEQHVAQEKLPAVSGSSGHLVIERLATAEQPATWPGQVFAETDLAYEEAMQQYVQATEDRQIHSRTPRDPQVEAPTRWRQSWEGRAERHQVLQQRKQEDVDWKTSKVTFRQARLAYRQLSKEQRDQQKKAWQAKQATWNQLRERRRRQQQERNLENHAWHQRNQRLKAGGMPDPPDRSWIAILVVTDNCTRQCLGLPVFRTGAKVTSQEVVEALKFILPAELQFLISDQGKHFRTKCMAQLAQEEDFAHVLVYRHRPESNGIAERFVLTFKDWLRSHSWQSVEELEEWVRRFQPEYNDRPHLGLGIPGLSPNEFAKRIWLM
jgi:transposase InsO family protein